MKVFLDFDDFTFSPKQWALIFKLKQYFEKFKVNLFCIPQASHNPIGADKNWGSFCLHGYKHEMNENVPLAKLNQWPFEKIYKAPFWQLTDKMYQRLINAGWKVMLNSENSQENKKGIYFNWNLKNEPDLTKESLIGHGHIQNVCGNGLQESLVRIRLLPKDTEFRFLSELDNQTKEYWHG